MLMFKWSNIDVQAANTKKTRNHNMADEENSIVVHAGNIDRTTVAEVDGAILAISGITVSAPIAISEAVHKATVVVRKHSPVWNFFENWDELKINYVNSAKPISLYAMVVDDQHAKFLSRKKVQAIHLDENFDSLTDLDLVVCPLISYLDLFAKLHECISYLNLLEFVVSDSTVASNLVLQVKRCKQKEYTITRTMITQQVSWSICSSLSLDYQ
ncbi:hypothetical protein ACH5RR_026174 [Cinchona calisaya]|uniref:Uncharacterized protein n=1 Tax=Cinchona calisaya TaxID=153742 RepID=A0ABD2Z506_9GENT